MYKLSEKSLTALAGCEEDIKIIVNEAIAFVDLTVLEGLRSKERQAELVRCGASKTLNSRHLANASGKSEAVDLAPYPIDWKDMSRFFYFAGFIVGLSKALKAQGRIKRSLVSGVDWDGDFNLKEHSFLDGPHFELERV